MNSQISIAVHTVGGGQDLGLGDDACAAHVGVVHAQGGGVGRGSGIRLIAAHDPLTAVAEAHQGQADQAQNQGSLLHRVGIIA